MKKSILLIPLLFIGSFTFAVEDFPAFPMTIYWNIKIGSSDLNWWTLKVYNSSNKELASYNITQNGKYWSDNVSILPLLLNQFNWSLTFKVTYEWKTYVVDSIDDSNRGEWCPSKNSITFVSKNCRYDITLKKQNSSNWWWGSSSWWGSSWWSSSSWWWSSSSNSSSNTTNTSTNKDNNTNNSAQTWSTSTNIESNTKIESNTDNWTKTENNDNVGKTLNNSVSNNNRINWAKKIRYNEWNPNEILSNWYSREYNNAYVFSYINWITTTPTIEKAKMDSHITRIAMAKMLSYYAINVLWMKPDASKWTIKFNDVTAKQNSDYDNAVTLSYQLWIMGQNIKDNNFRPNDTVTRAEFATALSRMLYWIEDWKWNVKYYEPHITKLYNEWIITNTNPKIKEKRWYIMVMLMRSAK